MNIAILIPAYNPDSGIVQQVRELAESDIEWLVVVDDGSQDEKARSYFKRIQESPKVMVLSHAENLGKGAAIKTGLRWIQDNLPACEGVVTVSSSGKHPLASVLHVAEELYKNPGCLVLGERTLDHNSPFLLRLSQKSTSWMVNRFWNFGVKDPQTTLRGVPSSLIPRLLKISYNRAEFDFEMLLVCRRESIPLYAFPAEDLFMESSNYSWFDPLRDSARLVFVLLRYVMASLLTASVDYLVFLGVYPFLGNLLVSVYLARLVSIVVNYTLTRNSVFYSKEKIWVTLPRYLALVLVSGFVASRLITVIESNFGLNVVFAKMASELILYFVNFTIMNRWVYAKRLD
jgi:glycosyltransferase involved in cell wall biosynthesis